MSDESRSGLDDLFAYWRAELAAVQRTDSRDASIWDEHAFLFRYGTAEELGQRATEAEMLLAWWQTRGGPYHPDGDREAIDGLRAAADRLHDLHERAVDVEARVRARGYYFDTESRTLKQVTGKPGRKAAIVSDAIRLAYTWLVTEQGYPEGQGAENREAVRECLRTTFHPSLLPDRKIQSAINSVQFPDRHY